MPWLKRVKSQHTNTVIQPKTIKYVDRLIIIPMAAERTKTMSKLEAGQNTDCFFMIIQKIAIARNTGIICQYPPRVYPAARHPVDVARQKLKTIE